MKVKTALLISSALLAVYVFTLSLGALLFMPGEGVRISARAADRAALMLGNDDYTDPGAELLPGELIDINSADAAQLQRLEGIGPVLADAIVKYRLENGDFSRIEDIMEVEGIGEGRFADIRENIVIGEDAREDSGS